MSHDQNDSLHAYLQSIQDTADILGFPSHTRNWSQALWYLTISGRTAHQAIRVKGSQDYGQRAVVISDTWEETTAPSDSEGSLDCGQQVIGISDTQAETTAHLDIREVVQDTDTEEAVIVSSDCEEVTQDAESEHERIPISDSEEQADSG